MRDHRHTETRNKPQGIGARVQCKEDSRHLHGKGNFVADMFLPGMCEVAFLRSPVAHALIGKINIPEQYASSIFTREMLDALDITADSTLPTYQSSAQPPLAQGKVRFVGEPVAMAFATSRAEAEDLLEEVRIDYDDLPIYADVHSSRTATEHFVHDDWNNNTFLTLHADRDFEKHSAPAEVIVNRKITLARQCMVPMEGKAVLAYWDHQADQLVIVSATQVPHMIRTAIALFLKMDQGQVRIISPDVGGAFGYKCVLQQE